jgi:AcrR family transcriptional regulator
MKEAREKKPVRQRILETASEMFYRDGVRAVGIDAIIARSGVAKMSLYRNFPSKDALVTAWLAERNAFFWQRWEKAEASCANDPRGQLEAILEMVGRTASHPKWRGCPFLNTSTEFPEPDHPARAVILTNKRAVRERLRSLAAAAGAQNPDLLAQQLQLLIDGAYSIGQSLGPDGPARTVASAGRELIAAQIEGHATDGEPQ